jgi:hypothetical protein
MAAILTNHEEICFGSFTMISPVLAAATSLAVVEQVATVLVTTAVSDLATETHPPKPYDIV